MRRSGWRHVVSIAIATGLLFATVAADAGTLDPIIDILPPAPVPYHSSTALACPDGRPSCINTTIRRMQDSYHALAAKCDHDAVFALAYLRVTQNVRDAINHGLFHDRAWLGNEDAEFAKYYFDTLASWNSGHRDRVPQAWRIALQSSDDGSVSALGNFLLAMNAHINRDFAYVLAGAGLTAKDGTSHKPDHNVFNPRLDSLYQPVFAEEAKELDPTFDDIELGPLDDEGVEAILRGWREIAWRNAEMLSLAKTPLAVSLAKANIETYAASQAILYKTMFSSSPTVTATRDAYCRARH